MESILAAISAMAILGGITAWVFAWKINNEWAEYTKRLIRETERMNADWADFYRMVCEKEKRSEKSSIQQRDTGIGRLENERYGNDR